MKPQLAVINDNNIISIRAIADQEYRNYKSAETVLIQHSNDQQLYKVVKMNYLTLKKSIDYHLSEFKDDPGSIDWEQKDGIVLNINCNILNFLSSVRTFLDHSETILKRRYGHESLRIQNYKKICAQVYDSNFSYRFLYKLRNYAQHCGMPVESIVQKSSIRVDELSGSNERMSLFFSREELLENYDSWGELIKSEIKLLDEKFEITPHVDEVMKCISYINSKLLEEEWQNLSKSAELVEDFISDTSGKNGNPCIMRIQYVNGDENIQNVQIEWIPLHLINQIKSMKHIPN